MLKMQWFFLGFSEESEVFKIVVVIGAGDGWADPFGICFWRVFALADESEELPIPDRIRQIIIKMSIFMKFVTRV